MTALCFGDDSPVELLHRRAAPGPRGVPSSGPDSKPSLPGPAVPSLALWLALLATSGFAASSPPATNAAPASPWSTSVQLGARESFDSNVFLQSTTPLANRESFVTTVLPRLGACWKADGSTFSASYAPEIAFFHDEPSENSTTHRLQADASIVGDGRLFECNAAFTDIDGSSVGPTWSGPGGAPATGGPAVRDRRDAAIVRAGGRLRQDLADAWFFRPGGTFYLHDFQTEHRASRGYQNYVDRSEFTVGTDIGRSVREDCRTWIGYRFGAQDESRLLNFRDECDNRLQRVLLGAEGTFARNVKGCVAVGPDWRAYGDRVPAAFGNRHRTTLFLDASLTVTPSPSDTVTASAREFEQPGFGGCAAYDDLTLDLTWRHRWAGPARWMVGAGVRAYHTDFLAPVVRNDWVCSANGVLGRRLSSHLNAEASYAFEEGLTRDDRASGREYRRHLVGLGVNYAFQ